MNTATTVKLGIIGCGNVLEAYLPQCAKLQARGLAKLVIACGRESQRQRAYQLGVPSFTTQEKEV